MFFINSLCYQQKIFLVRTGRERWLGFVSSLANCSEAIMMLFSLTGGVL